MKLVKSSKIKELLAGIIGFVPKSEANVDAVVAGGLEMSGGGDVKIEVLFCNGGGCDKILLTNRSLPFELLNPKESSGDDKIGGCSGCSGGRVENAEKSIDADDGTVVDSGIVGGTIGAVLGVAVGVGSGADKSKPSRSSKS